MHPFIQCVNSLVPVLDSTPKILTSLLAPHAELGITNKMILVNKISNLLLKNKI